MKKIIKYVVLALVLVIPVLVYLFLETFGDNKFTLPVFHEELAITEQINTCAGIESPHQVDISRYLPPTRENLEGSVYVVDPVLERCFDCPPNLNEIKRVLNRHKQLKIISLYTNQFTLPLDEENNLPTGWFTYGVDLVDFIQILRCQLILDVPFKTNVESLKETTRLVLIDGQGRIRGYYDKKSREEIDRLIIEVSILEQE